MGGCCAEVVVILLFAGAVAAGAAGGEEPERVFLKGGDVSLLGRIEERGGVYREHGEKREALAIFKGHGWNCVRLRLFHSPSGEGAVCNDLAYTVKLARRAKRAGFQILLDFHYSDTWADPGHQTKPAAWEGLAFEELCEAVFAYSRDCIAAFRKAGALPEIVQLGNEITPGMLWPDGRVGSSSATCAHLARMGGRGKLGLGTPYGIERLCGPTPPKRLRRLAKADRSSKPCSSRARGVPAVLWKRQTNPTGLALLSSVPSPSFPLWLRPEGAVGGKGFNTPRQWRQLAALLAAGRRGVEAALGEEESVEIMIHHANGGSVGGTRWLFDHLVEQKVEFDLIGLSYYPWWHGSLDDLRKNLAATAKRYSKPIVVVETAYFWNGAWPKGHRPREVAPWPLTQAGQKAFLADVIRTVRQTPDGRGRGVLWWAPEALPVGGIRGGLNRRALFDERGNALPAIEAFEE